VIIQMWFCRCQRDRFQTLRLKLNSPSNHARRDSCLLTTSEQSIRSFARESVDSVENAGLTLPPPVDNLPSRFVGIRGALLDSALSSCLLRLLAIP
jgi:hypothetical protein